MAWIGALNTDSNYDDLLETFAGEILSSYPKDSVASNNPCVLSCFYNMGTKVFWYRSNRDWKLSVDGTDLITETDQSDVNYKPPPPSRPVIKKGFAYYSVINSSGEQKIKKVNLETGVISVIHTSTALSAYRVRCNDADVSGNTAVFMSAGFNNWMVNWDCEQNNDVFGVDTTYGHGPFVEDGNGTNTLENLSQFGDSITNRIPYEGDSAIGEGSCQDWEFDSADQHVDSKLYNNFEYDGTSNPNPAGLGGTEYVVWSGSVKRLSGGIVELHFARDTGDPLYSDQIDIGSDWTFFKTKTTQNWGTHGVKARIRYDNYGTLTNRYRWDYHCLTFEGYEDVSYSLVKVDLTDDTVTTLVDEDITKPEFNLLQTSCGISGTDVYYEFSSLTGTSHYTPSAYKIGLDGTGKTSQTWKGQYGYNGMILEDNTLYLADQSKSWTLSYEPRELFITYDDAYPYYVVGFGKTTIWADKLASDGTVTKVKEVSLTEDYKYIGARPYKVRNGTQGYGRALRVETYSGQNGFQASIPYIDVI
jgi:hypothetical protein